MRPSLRVVAIGAVVSFIGTSAVALLTASRGFPPPTPLTPSATLDHFLSVLGGDRPADKLDRALHEFPAGSHLLMVAPESEPVAGQVYLTLAYLTYPLKLSAIFCGPPDKQRTLGPWDRGPVDGVLLLEMKLEPPDPAAQAIGKMIVTHRKSQEPWESFCH